MLIEVKLYFPCRGNSLRLRIALGVKCLVIWSDITYQQHLINLLYHHIFIVVGSIGFHDNDQLCLTEIERFASRVGITYTEIDVSRYSNGAYCDEALDESLAVVVTERHPRNVTITWEDRTGHEEFYYLVHYTGTWVDSQWRYWRFKL